MNSFENAERYPDPTAGKAIENVEREKKMEIKPGDVITFTRNMPNGSADVPFAVVAVNGTILTGVKLYDTELAQSVRILCRGEMFAQPEKLEWINYMRVDVYYVRTMSAEEFNALREGISNALSVSIPVDEVIDTAAEQAAELIKARAKAEVYEHLYTNLLEKYVNEAKP